MANRNMLLGVFVVAGWLGGCRQVLGFDADYELIGDGPSAPADGGISGDASQEADGKQDAEATECDGGAQPVGVNGEPCCTPNELACAGHAQKLVLICEPKGTIWIALQSCIGDQLCETTPGSNQGTCQEPVAACIGKSPGDHVCDGLKAIECGPDLLTSTETTCQYVCKDGSCQGECSPQARRCQGVTPQECDGEGAWQSGEACSGATPVCQGGQCAARPSCVGLASTCGGNDDCCASSVVPGGTFNRSNDVSYPAVVSDFRLDTYEVTVGRFRKFAEAYSQAMTPSGAGKNPNDASDTGWKSEWNASLPADVAALRAAVKCEASHQTWTDSAGANESRPINCVTWYYAYAFCIWDGGRLPTEAEWNYAAAGGSEQRIYPWSSPPNSTTIDSSNALYCAGTYQTCEGPLSSGLKSPRGDGRWGQTDLAGNVEEFVRDWYGDYRNPCVNCANLTANYPVTRGGGWYSGADDLRTSVRAYNTATVHSPSAGFRCARTP